MRNKTERQLLLDHVDMRLVSVDEDATAADRNRIVELDPDHPGFRDPHYRARRNRIAQIALDYKAGRAIPDAPYTEAEHQVWRQILEALTPVHEIYACAEYLACLGRLALPSDRIPQLHEVSDKVQAISGFRLEPVAGLVEPRVFLENLANGVFLCTQYIRHHSTPLYTPEPDVAHEIIGHAVTLASERLADLNRLFGAAVKRTQAQEDLDRLARLYWFTLEFGLVREGGTEKAYGTGLLSSAGELQTIGKADLRPLDLEAASRQIYDPTCYQPILFVADSFASMYGLIRDYLVRWQ